MKKTHYLLTGAALLVAAASSATAADVTMYGLIDIGGKYDRSTGSDATFEMNSGQIAGSRFGLRAKEVISSDLTVYINLENGFDADTGELADDEKLFNRNSVLGLQTKYGTFELGRTGALTAGVTGGIFAGKVSPFGITWQEAQSSQLLSGAASTRLDNQIRYESPKVGGFQFYAQASNGIADDDGVPSSQKDRYAAVGTVYKNGPLMVVAVADRMFTKNSTDKTYNLDDYSTYNIGGTYDFGSVKLFAAYQYGDGVTKVGKISDLGSDYKPMGFDTHAVLLGANIDLMGGTLKLATGYATGEGDYTADISKDARKSGKHEADGYQFGIGYLYPLSKRTDLYAGAAYVHKKNEVTPENEAKTAENTHQRSVIFGMRHRF